MAVFFKGNSSSYASPYDCELNQNEYFGSQKYVHSNIKNVECILQSCGMLKIKVWEPTKIKNAVPATESRSLWKKALSLSATYNTCVFTKCFL